VDERLVLVISEAADWSADAVVNELRHRNVPVFRLDTGDFPQRMRVSARLRDGWAGLIGTDAGDLDLSMVAGVYYRRPRTFDLPNGLSGPERRFAQQQARVGIGGLLASLPTRWINHPSAIADCEYKPRQLAVAASVGFTTPATLITNDPDAVRDFAADIGDLVVKPFADPLVHEAGDTSIVYTRRLRPADLVDLSGVETTAHLFQQWVEPQPCAVRLTVVGESMFGASIYPESPAAREDWRADYAALRYEPLTIPVRVADRARGFLDAFGLVYGAFDLILNQNEYVFLECNAAGQFGWLSEECDLPIAAAIADEFIKE